MHKQTDPSDLSAAERGAAPDAARPRFVLASSSSRRLELLAQLGLAPDAVTPAHVDETPQRNERAAALAARLALAKARAVAADEPDAVVLGADTVVACGRRLLPKAEDADTARVCLKLLSGRRHRVIGGVAVIGPGGRTHRRTVVTAVAFKRLTPAEIEDYVVSDEWHGKAGGYGIQGRAAGFVRFVNGSYSNVVGLPLFEVAQVLKAERLL